MAENEVLPRFFKVFLSETCSDSLPLPLSYMEHLAAPLPNTAKLQGTGGRDWTVSLTKIHDAVYFTDGWSKFVEDHELVDGEFLTFVYDGNRTFEVSVFGRSGCKENRAVAEILEVSDSDSEEDEDEELSVDIDDDTSFREDEELSVEVDDDTSFREEEEISQSLHPSVDEETESDAAGNLHVESLTNPHFTTTLKNRIYELLIPAHVVKENKLRFGDSVKYIDGGVGTVIGKRGKWSDDRVCFKGWDRICRRNRLKKHQDTVEVELLHDQKKVHSIRIHVMNGTT